MFPHVYVREWKTEVRFLAKERLILLSPRSDQVTLNCTVRLQVSSAPYLVRTHLEVRFTKPVSEMYRQTDGHLKAMQCVTDMPQNQPNSILITLNHLGIRL
jgi:hypothetical protein